VTNPGRKKALGGELGFGGPPSSKLNIQGETPPTKAPNKILWLFAQKSLTSHPPGWGVAPKKKENKGKGQGQAPTRLLVCWGGGERYGR